MSTAPWICNKGRDLAHLFERPRAEQAMRRGMPVELADATAAAATLLAGATRIGALISSWASNEELAAFASTLGTAFRDKLTAVVKADHLPQPGEIVEDELLIQADKNPNTTAARALYPMAPADLNAALAGADVVLVWGEGVAAASLPAGARIIRLESYAHADLATADVFLPISIMTERSGHFTNAAGVVSGFTAAFTPRTTVAHADALFAQLAAPAGVTA